jgi:hypothetical protein
MAETEYYRLTRSRRRSEGFRMSLGTKRASLWMGKDHLLSITENSYSEEYKRFYFRDIQAITVCVTRRRAILNVTLTIAMMASFAILRLMISAQMAAIVALAVFAVPFLVNNIRGTACKVFVRTMVQTEQLSSLDRIAKARQILDRIRPLISTAQGQLTADQLSERIKNLKSPTINPASTVREHFASPLNLSQIESEPVASPGTEETK